MQLKICALSELKESAQLFLKHINESRVFAFHGEMGSGKTTFINAVLRELGIEDHSSSPTFSIVNEYHSPENGVIYHFDFYRIEDEEEAFDIGIEDLLYDSAFCFIEWPERIENLLPQNCVNIFITVENGCRLIDISL